MLARQKRVASFAKMVEEQTHRFIEEHKTNSRPTPVFTLEMWLQGNPSFINVLFEVVAFYKGDGAAAYYEFGHSKINSADLQFRDRPKYELPDLKALIAELAECKKDGTPLLESLIVKLDSSPLGPDTQIYQTSLKAVCEMFNISDSTENSADFNIAEFVRQSITQTLQRCLRATPPDVNLWNSFMVAERAMIEFADVDLHNKDLRKIECVDMNFSNANFRNSDLRNARFAYCNIRAADFFGSNLSKADLDYANAFGADFSSCDAKACSFKKCTLDNALFTGSDLTGANLRGAGLTGSDFTSAKLLNVSFESADLRNANFQDCDLTGCDFYDADLRGANLQGCTGSDVMLKFAQTDKLSKIPADLRHWSHRKSAYSVTAKTVQALTKLLKENYEETRIAQSLRMLKKDVFQLYSDSTEESLSGIVKSQSDQKLVYACRLTSEGHFSCCTQNLRPCGGLKGELCKHIIVLILGIANAKLMNCTKLARWVLSSKYEDPSLNKEIMSQLFLKYKSVDAGEFDWRPTTTIPEDYFAL